MIESMLEGRLNNSQLEELAVLDNPDTLDYELILDQCTESMQQIVDSDSQFSGLNIGSLSESDPLSKLLELTAYRELLARQQINESIEACRLSTAQGNDLERLAELMLSPTQERHNNNDDVLRTNILNQYQVLHTAGSVDAYKHFAMVAVPSGLIVDIKVASPEPGVVDICLLFHSKLHIDKSSVRNDFIGPRRSNHNFEIQRENYLLEVQRNLEKEHVRPIGHYVCARQAQIKTYSVKARLGLFNQPGASEVLATARREVWRYITGCYRLGATVYRSGILSALHQASVHYILLDELVPGAGKADVGLNSDYAPLCELLEIEIDTQVPDETVREATLRAVKIENRNLSCDLVFKPPANEVRITHYLVYWGTSQGIKLFGMPPVAKLAAGGDKHIRLVDIAIPEGAGSLNIFTANQNGEMEEGYIVQIAIDDNGSSGQQPESGAEQ